MDAAGTRLQKYLSARGVVSRRRAAALIRAGQVLVDGEVITEPGMRIPPRASTVTINGVPVEGEFPPARTILLYKPRGFICSRSSSQGHTVCELFDPTEENLVTVGRLDKNSEGLLLLSNDGGLVNRLTHPRYGHRKTYRVTVSGQPGAAAMRVLRSTMDIDGYRIRPAEVKLLRKANREGRFILEFTLCEGRNRQIRRMCELAGLNVHRLVRTRMAGLSLKGLKPGQWRELTTAEAERLDAC